MNDIVNEAAGVLVPLLAGGATAAVEEASKAAGKKFAVAVGTVVDRIRKYLRHPVPEHPDVVAALQAGVDVGVIGIDDLERLVRLSKHRVGDTNVNVSGDVKNVVTDPQFNAPVVFE